MQNNNPLLSPIAGRSRLLWSTQGGGILQVGNNANPPSAASLNVSGNSGALDVNGAYELLIVAVLSGFTGGTSPSFQPEWDLLDDNVAAGVWTPNAVPLWKPTAVTAAAKFIASLGATGLGAAPTITGWTVASVPFGFGQLGQLVWTVTGAPTAVNWAAFVYGKGAA